MADRGRLPDLSALVPREIFQLFVNAHERYFGAGDELHFAFERRRADERSVLHLYRRLLALRRTSRALREGGRSRCATPRTT